MAQLVKNLPAKAGDARDNGFDPWRRKWQPTPVIWPGIFMDREAWQATVHRVAESRTQLHILSLMHVTTSLQLQLASTW